MGGLQGQSRQVRKISPPPGFDSWTVQPVVSHCTVYAIPTYWYGRHFWFVVDRPAFSHIVSLSFIFHQFFVLIIRASSTKELSHPPSPPITVQPNFCNVKEKKERKGTMILHENK
jgi:hypothetical protein